MEMFTPSFSSSAWPCSTGNDGEKCTWDLPGGKTNSPKHSHLIFHKSDKRIADGTNDKLLEVDPLALYFPMTREEMNNKKLMMSYSTIQLVFTVSR